MELLLQAFEAWRNGLEWCLDKHAVNQTLFSEQLCEVYTMHEALNKYSLMNEPTNKSRRKMLNHSL